ncbi:hypothetical protein EKO04_002415 [Ascochyta lentis]|uniref:Uncharacterized protein n=1 Tax=Ascochyta lentis TaxID=205686 RepID=A0A8H7JBW3_9PLEO|nr:hypothetical protein EKO04_002415 [Ascochyta lentis]
MGLEKRYCVEIVDGTIECFRDGGFWSTQKGQIVKWSILGSLFGLFMLWFIGGYLHARRRLKAGKPLLKYHRFLVSWQEYKHYGQTPPPRPPQSHFTFYDANAPNPYQNRPAYQQRADGSGGEAPPLYNGGDAPPVYGGPPGAVKLDQGQTAPMEMPRYGGQQGDLEQGASGGREGLPPRPPQKARAVLRGVTDRFRK